MRRSSGWIAATIGLLALSSCVENDEVTDDGDAGDTDADADADTDADTETGEQFIPPEGWEIVDTGMSLGDLAGVWGSAPDDVYVTFRGGGGIHWNGTVWSVIDDMWAGGSGVWGTSASDVFAFGGSGVFHFDGTTWSLMTISPSATLEECDVEDSPEYEYSRSIRDVWGLPGGPYYAGGEECCIYDDGDVIEGGCDLLVMELIDGQWTATTVPWPPSASEVMSIWGSAADDVYVAYWFGDYQHFDGTSWTWMPPCAEEIDSSSTWQIQGLSADEIYSFGNISCRFDGEGWNAIGPLAAVGGIASCGWVLSPGVVYVAGSTADFEHGIISRGGGTNDWEIVASDLPFIPYAVWGTVKESDDGGPDADAGADGGVSGAQDVWVVGSGGVILHYPAN